MYYRRITLYMLSDIFYTVVASYCRKTYLFLVLKLTVYIILSNGMFTLYINDSAIPNKTVDAYVCVIQPPRNHSNAFMYCSRNYKSYIFTWH